MGGIRNSTHEELGARFGEFEGRSLPESYGDPAAEHLVVRQDAGFLDRSLRGRLRVSGADRAVFLQRLVSNDVNALTEESGSLSTLLTPKGKLLADLLILHRGDHFLLDLSPLAREDVAKKLEMYVLSSDVRVKDVTDDLALLTVAGPQADAILGKLSTGKAPPELYGSVATTVAGQQAVVVRTDHLGGSGYDLHLPVKNAESVLSALVHRGAKPVGWSAGESLRIEAGVPRFGAEMNADLLPAEIPWLADRAVSYTKGCFVGQETVARIRTYGHVNRELMGFMIDGTEPPAPGAALRAGDQVAGTITSACLTPTIPNAIALGFVKRKLNVPGATFEVDTPSGSVAANMVPPGGPWRCQVPGTGT